MIVQVSFFYRLCKHKIRWRLPWATIIGQTTFEPYDLMIKN